MEVVIQLMEMHLSTLGNKDEEDKVWDIVLQGRAKSDDCEKRLTVSIQFITNI